jgi:hypothetical protein
MSETLFGARDFPSGTVPRIDEAQTEVLRRHVPRVTSVVRASADEIPVETVFVQPLSDPVDGIDDILVNHIIQEDRRSPGETGQVPEEILDGIEDHLRREIEVGGNFQRHGFANRLEAVAKEDQQHQKHSAIKPDADPIIDFQKVNVHFVQTADEVEHINVGVFSLFHELQECWVRVVQRKRMKMSRRHPGWVGRFPSTGRDDASRGVKMGRGGRAEVWVNGPGPDIAEHGPARGGMHERETNIGNPLASKILYIMVE